MVQRQPIFLALQWRHNGPDSVSNHQPHHCLLNRLFRRRSKKTSKLCVTGLCVGNSPETGEFPAQMASNAEKNDNQKVSIWWRHHGKLAHITSMQYRRQTPMFVNILMHLQHSLIYTHTQIGGAYLTPLRPRQNDNHFVHDILKRVLNENARLSIKMSLDIFP